MADRWHLAKNLTDHLNKVVSTRWKQLTKAACEDEMAPGSVPLSPPALRPRQAPGEARYQQMLVLKEAGLPTGSIAKRLGVGARTIQRWLAEGHGPYAGPRQPRRSPLDWSTHYLRQRWDEGEHNGTVLWEELKAQGYGGSMRSVYRRLAKWHDHLHTPGSPASHSSVPRSPLEDMTPGQVIGWMLARRGTLTAQAQEQLDHLCQMDDQLAQARELTHGFLDRIRRHTAEGLDAWLKDVRASTLRQFLPFARSIERDKAAILAGLELPYSTGPVEGHVNRLKLDLSASVWPRRARLLARTLRGPRLDSSYHIHRTDQDHRPGLLKWPAHQYGDDVSATPGALHSNTDGDGDAGPDSRDQVVDVCQGGAITPPSLMTFV